MPSIRQQIATYVSDTLTAAVLQTSGSTVTAGKVIELKHKASILAVAAQKPALHFALGDETAGEVIDNQGCTLTCPLDLKIVTADYLDLPATVEVIAAAVQDAIEADRTFGGLLCDVLRYDGRQEFLETAAAPDGGTVLSYRIQYRRKHGDTDGAY